MKEWDIMHRRSTRDMTVLTALAFVPGWMKYFLVPLPIKYLIHLVWLSLRRRLLYPTQKKWVKVEAKIDAYCSRVGARRKGRELSGRDSYSFGMVWARFHGRVSPWQDIRYRLRLLRSGDVSCWKSYYTKSAEGAFLEEKAREEKEEEEGTFYQDEDRVPAPDVLEGKLTDEEWEDMFSDDDELVPASN